MILWGFCDVLDASGSTILSPPLPRGFLMFGCGGFLIPFQCVKVTINRKKHEEEKHCMARKNEVCKNARSPEYIACARNRLQFGNLVLEEKCLIFNKDIEKHSI